MSSPEITITIQGDRTVRVRDQDGAEASGKVETDSLRKATIEIFENWLNKSRISERRELEVLGMHLYNMLFNGEVKSFFEKRIAEATLVKASPDQRVRVQLSFQGEAAAELARLPWEYLYRLQEGTSRGFFLSTRVALVLSRFMPSERARESLSVEESPLRILIVVSKPVDLGPVLTGDVIDVIQKLKDVKVDLLEAPTVTNFLDKLGDVPPHVLHFIGHGRFQGKQGSIALLKPDGQSAEWITDQAFAEYFENMGARPRLVFLHLCEGATVDFNANFAGLAPQLILAGIPAVVAMQYPITNKAAISFSRAFYRELMKGEPIDHAVQQARWQITIDDNNAYNTRVFGTPVLYMHSRDGIIQPGARSGREEPKAPIDRPAQILTPERASLERSTSAEDHKPEWASPKLPKDGFTPKDDETGKKTGKLALALIFLEAEKKMKERNFSELQKEAIRARLVVIQKELEEQNPDQWNDALAQNWFEENDADMKEILFAMLEKLK